MPADVISIIGGGWSAGLVDLATVPGLVVAVNNAAIYAPRVDVLVTMDRKFSEHWWPRHIRPKGEAGGFEFWARESAARNLPRDVPFLNRFKNNHLTAIFSDDPNTLNGTNSGGCALAWAYARRPKTVYLFGYDLRPGPRGEGHWYGRNEPRGVAEVGSAPIHEARYAGWAREYDDRPSKQFRDAGIEVVNVSDNSLIRSFRRLSPGKFNAGAR